MSKLPKRSWSILLQTVKGASRSFILCSALWILASSLSPAQQNGIDQDSEIIIVPGGENLLRWHGHAGRSYFVQVSDTNDPLRKWKWAPIIDAANNSDISHQVGATAGKAFFRLKYTNQVPGPTETLDTADFDQDGLSNIDEIKPPLPLLGGDATDPLDPDTDHDGLSDGYERINGLGPNDPGTTNPDNGPNGDPDDDGLTNAEELALGTGPTDPDSDDDLLKDGEDAVPKDEEINWEKTPEARYVWVEQVAETETPNGPIAVNKRGQILFGGLGEMTGTSTTLLKSLWDSSSKSWKPLPIKGSSQTITPKVNQLYAINDEGLVTGRSVETSELALPGIPYPVDNKAGMLWKKDNSIPPAYISPKYFMPEEAWVIDNRQYGILELGGIGKNGEVNCFSYLRDANLNTIYNWDLYLSAGENYNTHTISPLDSNESGMPGAIYDSNHCLFIHRDGTSTSTNAESLYYWDGLQRSTVTGVLLDESPPLIKTSLSTLPGTLNSNSNRVWLCATGTASAVRIETWKSNKDRWQQITSMSEGAIRLNARGEAITSGDPNAAPPIPPKLWRNGKYKDLNKVTSKPTTVTITKAIDLASNGVILVQAKEGTVNKTGILMPIRVTGVNASVSPVNLDAPDRGVDNISILAEDKADNGNQAEYWVMAPISGTNTVRFLTAASQALPVELSATNATFNPAILTSPDQQVTVTGTGTTTSDAQLKLKIGTQEVQSPIKVKAMKKRTVKVTVHAVGLNVEPLEVPTVPDLGVIQTYLNSVFLPQLNAEITVTPGPAESPLSWDMGRASIYEMTGPGSEKLHEGNGTFDFKGGPALGQEDGYINLTLSDKNADINVYILTRHFLGWFVQGGKVRSESDTVGITRRTPRVIVIDGKQNNKIIPIIAHEIGHCMIGYGHPDLTIDPLDIAAVMGWGPPRNRGVAPHDGVGTEEWKKRLMYSTVLPVSGKTLVKSEWDAAETWLTGLPYGRPTP